MDFFEALLLIVVCLLWVGGEADGPHLVAELHRLLQPQHGHVRPQQVPCHVARVQGEALHRGGNLGIRRLQLVLSVPVLCTVLYCTVLYCVLYCTALYCTNVYCTVLY